MISRRLAVLVLCLLTLPATLTAQWRRSPGPTGGDINMIVPYGGVLYAASGSYGPGDLFVSTDTAKTWTPFGETLPDPAPVLSLAVGKNQIYAGTTRGLFYSGLWGPTWVTIDSVVPKERITAIQIAPNDSDVIVAAFNEGLYRTRDLAHTWAPIAATGNFASASKRVTSIFREGKLLLVTTQGMGVWRSSDDGASWEDVGKDFFADDQYTMCVLRDKDHLLLGTLRNVMRSNDDGRTWSLSSTGLPNSNGPTQLVSDGHTVYACIQGYGVWRSTDEGSSWSELDASPYISIESIALLAGKLYGAIGREAIHAWDEPTQSWIPTSRGIADVSVLSLRPVMRANGRHEILAGTLDADFGLAWHTPDSGATWEEFPRFTTRGIHDMLEARGVLLAASDGEGIFRSVDEGQNWSQPGVPAAASYVVGLAATPTHLLGATAGFGVYTIYSSDDGATWQTSTTQPSQQLDHLFYDAASGLTFGLSSIGLYVSSDEGVTWSASSGFESATRGMNGVAGRSYGIARSGSRLFVGSFTGLFVSSDNGATWDSLPSRLSGNRVTAIISYNGNLIASTPHELFFSTDQGSSWGDYDATLPTAVDVISLAAADQMVYAGTNGYGVFISEFPVPSAVRRADPASQLSLQILQNGGRPEVRYALPSGTSQVRFRVMDVTGRSLSSWSEESGEGTHSFELPAFVTKPLAGGLYFLEARCAGARSLARFLVTE